MKPRSYIGVTGFNTLDQVHRVNDAASDYPIGYFMYGFTSSNKRLLDPTSSGKTSPALNTLNELVAAVPNHHLPMVHYFTSNPDTLHEEVVALFNYCELKNCGLQLNATWPHPNKIRHILQKLNSHSWDGSGNLPITLQLPHQVLRDYTDNQILQGVQQYEGLISYVLIDPSGGTGQDVDLSRASKLLEWFNTSLDTITPGVAGGFSAENIADRIKGLYELAKCQACCQSRLRDFCIDAQGKLHKEEIVAPVYPQDAETKKVKTLSPDLAIEYINNALLAFSEEQ